MLELPWYNHSPFRVIGIWQQALKAQTRRFLNGTLSLRSKTLVGNSDLMLVFDTKKRWTNIVTPNQIYDITQNYGWYEGSPGKKKLKLISI